MQGINLIKIVIIASIGGLLGAATHLPGGTILGALICVGIVKLLNIIPIGSLPKSFTFVLQILAGILLGIKINLREPISLHEIFIPAFLSSFLMLAVTIIMAIIIHKTCKWDLTTSWLACAPGRTQDMIIIANDLKADCMKVTISHTSRMILIVSASPIILHFLR